MADLTKSSDAGLVKGEYKIPFTRQAGVELAAEDAVFIDSNGKFQKAGTGAGVLISGAFGVDYKFDGLTVRSIPSGTFGEIYGAGSEHFYADSGLTIGAPIYPSNTAGKLANAPIAANDQPVAIVTSATNIRLIKGV